MRKIYHLGTCSTNQKIIRDLKITPSNLEFQDIKTEPITAEQLDKMKDLAGSYDALFSRRAMKYRAWKLGEKKLSEKDIRDYILQEYTFLKRPVVILDDQIFIGNSPSNLKSLAEALQNG